MTKVHSKEKALRLRKNGKTIGEIAEKLSVSKSTASMWCKNILLSDEQIAAIALRSKHKATQALLRAAESKRRKRISDIDEAMTVGGNDIKPFTKRDLFMVGLGLYWGEGYKRGSQELGFTNSDPNMIKFYLKWLNEMYGVKNEDLILRVSINCIHKKREREIERYWSEITTVPLSQFTKTSFIQTASKKRYLNHKEHFGTLRVKVRRGTQTRRRILGSIAALTPHQIL